MVLGATWNEIEGLDGNTPVWRVPAGRMKTRDEFVSPLPGAALDILQAVRRLRAKFGEGRFTFLDWHQSSEDEPLSDDCFNAVLKLHEHSAHGFRSSFSTIELSDENAIEA